MRTAAIYLRMSLDNDLGIDRQREDCLKLCEAKGWQPVEYADNDRSAASGKVRPAYKRMLEDIAAGDIDAVVAWDLDRLHRRPIELEKFMELADKHSLALATISGDVDLSTPQGQLLARMKGAVARHEVDQMKSRQARALLQIAESGRGWGNPCFGYNGDHENPQIVPEEAVVIRQAYTDVLAGSTLYSIAKAWNDGGFRTRPRGDRPNGNTWTATTVRRLLCNPRMAGLRQHKGEVVGKADWEAIIDQETWEAAMHILRDPTRRRNAVQVRKYHLGGILRCGGCGAGLGSGLATARNGGYPVYKCKERFAGGRKCPAGVCRPQHPLDDWVRDLVIKRIAQKNWTPPGDTMTKAEAAKLHEEINQVRTRLDGLVEDYADGTLNKQEYRLAKERLHGRLEILERQASRSAKNRIFDGLIGLNDPGKVAKVIDGMHIDRRRALYEAMFHKIVVHQMGLRGRQVRTAPTGHNIEVFWNDDDTACVAKVFPGHADYAD